MSHLGNKYHASHPHIRTSASSDAITTLKTVRSPRSSLGPHGNEKSNDGQSPRTPASLNHAERGYEYSSNGRLHPHGSVVGRTQRLHHGHHSMDRVYPSSPSMTFPQNSSATGQIPHSDSYSSLPPQAIPNSAFHSRHSFNSSHPISSAIPRTGRIGSNPSLLFSRQDTAQQPDMTGSNLNRPPTIRIDAKAAENSPTSSLLSPSTAVITERIELGSSHSTPSFHYYYTFKAIRLFITVVILPSVILPSLLHVLPLQDPHSAHGYAGNWVWAGVLMPLTIFLISVFPTFVVSGIMGSLKSAAQALAWRISSITFACGASLGLYALVAENIYPRFSRNHSNFPVPWTGLWLPPITTAVATFTARLIRLQSDWRLPSHLSNSPNVPDSPSQRLPPSSVLQYASRKIRRIIRETSLIYILSMTYCSMILMVFQRTPSSTDTRAEDLTFFYYKMPILVSLVIGKHLAVQLVKRVLASGGLYKLVSRAASSNSKAAPNIQIVVIGAEYWWNLTECILVSSFLTRTMDIIFVHVLFIAECGYRCWRMRDQVLHLRQLSSSAVDIEPSTATPSTALNSSVSPKESFPKIGRSASFSTINGLSPTIETFTSTPLSRLHRSNVHSSSEELTEPDSEKASFSPLVTRKRKIASASYSSLTNLANPNSSSSPGLLAVIGSVSELYPAELSPAKKKFMSSEVLNLGSPIAYTLQTLLSFSLMRLVGLLQLSVFYLLIPVVNQQYLRPVHIHQWTAMVTLNLIALMGTVKYSSTQNIKLIPDFLVMVELAAGQWTSLFIASMGWLTLWFVEHGGSFN